MSSSSRHRRIARMHALRDAAAEWAAAHHPQDLEPNLRRWLGPHEATEHRFHEAISFALVTGHDDGGPSLLERFRAARPPSNRLERSILDAWRDARFGVFEVLEVQPGESLLLEDVITGGRWQVRERSASTMLAPGAWLLLFLVVLDGQPELEGTNMLLRGASRFAAVQAMLSGIEALGLRASSLSGPESRRLAPRVVAAARHQQQRPRLVNRDGDPIAPTDTTLEVSWADFLAVVSTWEDVHEDEDEVTLLGPVDAHLGGPLSRASFRPHGPGGATTEVFTNSIERLERALALWEERTGRPLRVRTRQTAAVDSNPDGPEVMVDQAVRASDGRSLAEAQRDLEGELAATWLDIAIPALGGQTPREAAAAGRRAELRALLPESLGAARLATLRAELGV